MKNKILSIPIFVMTLLTLLFTNVSKVSAETYSGEIKLGKKIENTFVYKKSSTGKVKYEYGFFLRRSTDNQYVYCLQPFVDLNNDHKYNVSSSDYATYLNLTDAQWERISLLAYYGYNYENHTADKWYFVTQYLIWKTAEPSATIVFTESLEGTKNENLFKDEINEINTLVADHQKKPSVSLNSNNVLNVGETITLADSNKVLSGYKIKSTNNVSASIIGNTLKVTGTDVGSSSITLVKEDSKYKNVPVIYFSPYSQNAMVVGSYNPITITYKFETVGGKVELTKSDRITGKNAQGEATLKGAVYGVYDSDNNLITKLTTDNNSYAISDYLPKLGSFYLQEITPSRGYKLDDTKYWFTIDSDNLIAKVNVYEEVITGTLDITKVYASDKTEIMTPEVGVKFGIYDTNNNEVSAGTTDENGKINVTLPYGKYTLKQLTSTYGYEKIDDFKFEIKSDNEKISKTFSDAQIKAKLKVIKVDKETGEIIKRANIKFKIFDVTREEYVCQTITYPTSKTICEFSTDENGILITPYPLLSGTYKLEEVDQPLDGYLWNRESVEFSIDEYANLTTDNEYGILFETKFENTRIMGSVIITKKGEALELTDDGYVYTEINLSGVKIGLYANDDIKDATGNLIYTSDTKIGEYVTDELGNITIDNLYLGSYYLLELETVNNHVLDTSKYEFNLEYKDQYTPVVEYQITIKNHLPKGKLIFTKTDMSESKTLPNTKIEIYTENDELIFIGITDFKGQIVIDELPIGKYYILEKDAPKGYTLNPNKMNFEIKEDGEIVKSTMKDELIIKVPDTGKNSLPIISISISCLILGLGLIIYGAKKKK